MQDYGQTATTTLPVAPTGEAGRKGTSKANNKMTTELEKQKRFIESADAQKLPDLVSAKNFVAGMRKLGYRSTGHALDELIDNSMEAGANKIGIYFGFTGKSRKKPTEIAIVDDGIGMPGELIRFAVAWGGTHRPDSRDFFGRFGFGLPSSCMSIGKRFEIFSKQNGGPWQMVSIDLDEIVEDDPKYNDGGHIRPPKPVSEDIPAWVKEEASKHIDLDASTSATVVVIKKIDSLSFKNSERLQDSLAIHFGTVYNHLLHRYHLYINDLEIDRIDPLFVDPKARFHDIDNGKTAVSIPDLDIPVNYERAGKKGTVSIRVRFSYLPIGFHYKDGSHRNRAEPSQFHNGRDNVMRENHGIIFLRQGRQIEVVRARLPREWGTIVNNDRHCRIEVDFPAVLDEFFDIPTSKQQVIPTEEMWKLLKGILRHLTEMRKLYKKEVADWKGRQEVEEELQRLSETAMDELGTTGRKSQLSRDRQEEAERNLQDRAKKKATETGRPIEETKVELQKDVETGRYKVEFESLGEGPFYKPRLLGGRLELVINTDHRFFRDWFSSPESTKWTKSCLEALLFVMAIRETDAPEELAEIYQQERTLWSMQFQRILSIYERQSGGFEEDLELSEQMAEDEAGDGQNQDTKEATGV